MGMVGATFAFLSRPLMERLERNRLKRSAKMAFESLVREGHHFSEQGNHDMAMFIKEELAKAKLTPKDIGTSEEMLASYMCTFDCD